MSDERTLDDLILENKAIVARNRAKGSGPTSLDAIATEMKANRAFVYALHNYRTMRSSLEQINAFLRGEQRGKLRSVR